MSIVLEKCSQILPHKPVDGLVQGIHGLVVAGLHSVHDAVGDVVLEDDPAGAVQGGDHRRQLQQHLRAVLAPLHHFAHRLQVPLGPGQAIQNGLGLGMAVGMRMGVVVVMVVGMGMLVHGQRAMPFWRAYSAAPRAPIS